MFGQAGQLQRGFNVCEHAHAAQLPKQLLLGARVVELGAGPGLPGLFAATCGAFVTITDLEKVVPLIEQNILANSVAVGNETLAESQSAAQHGGTQRSHIRCGSRCVGKPLQWGSEGGLQQARLLGAQGVDYVVACDTCYVDPVCIPCVYWSCLRTLFFRCNRPCVLQRY